MQWPKFREAALRIGLQASLSIPLFAGSGHPVAALNLYSLDSGALIPLSAAILAAFQLDAVATAPVIGHLDPGGEELVAALVSGMQIQMQIQIALGLLMARFHLPASAAYLNLREQAAASGLSLLAAANELKQKAV